MWIISPTSIASEILDDVMETFDHSWEEYLSLHERLSESDSNSDSDGASSEEHSGPSASNLNASMDRVLWAVEPEFEWIAQQKADRDILVFRFLQDALAVKTFCVYDFKHRKAEAIIKPWAS